MTDIFRARQFSIINLADTDIGPIADYTKTFNFNLVNFDWVTWHNYEWQNWVQVDALLNTAVGFLQLRGIWRPLTDYTVGDGVYDPDDVTKLYRAQNTHTSTTDFDADVTAGRWTQVTALGPPVTSVFGRLGAIVALEADYSTFFYTKAQTYTKTEVDASQTAQNTVINGNTAAIAALDASTYSKTEADAQWAVQDTRDDGQDTLIANNASAITAANTNANNRVLKAGDTMTGALVLLATDPTAAAHAANKQYVDKRMRWRGLWAAGTYQANDVVLDGAYMFVAKQTTTQKPDNGNRPPNPTEWDLMTTGGSAAVTVSATPPTTPLSGEMWFSTVAPVGMFMWYVDVDSAQWISVSGGVSGASGGSGSTAWDDITGKPATFPPTLPIAQSGVTGLVTDLAGKAATVHTHAQSDVTGLVTALAAKVPEAPADNIQYARIDAAWAPVVVASYGNVQGYTYNPASTTPPPATGNFRMNNATQSAVTLIYLSVNNEDGLNLHNYILQRFKVKDTLYIQSRTDATKWQLYEVSGTVVDNTTYVNIPVIWKSGGGALTNQRCVMSRDSAGAVPDVGEAPNDGKNYGRKSLAWTPVFTQLTQAAYDALSPPDANTLYVVVG